MALPATDDQRNDNDRNNDKAEDRRNTDRPRFRDMRAVGCGCCIRSGIKGSRLGLGAQLLLVMGDKPLTLRPVSG